MRSAASPRAVSSSTGTSLVLRSEGGEAEAVLARHHHVEHDQVEGEVLQMLARSAASPAVVTR